MSGAVRLESEYDRTHPGGGRVPSPSALVTANSLRRLGWFPTVAVVTHPVSNSDAKVSVGNALLRNKITYHLARTAASDQRGVHIDHNGPSTPQPRGRLDGERAMWTGSHTAAQIGEASAVQRVCDGRRNVKSAAGFGDVVHAHGTGAGEGGDHGRREAALEPVLRIGIEQPADEALA